MLVVEDQGGGSFGLRLKEAKRGGEGWIFKKSRFCLFMGRGLCVVTVTAFEHVLCDTLAVLQ